MAKEEVVIYKATGCESCEDLERLVNSGNFVIEGIGEKDIGVRLTDITTEEGFEELQKVTDIVDAVPMALLDGKVCRILIDEEEDTLYLQCPGAVIPSEEPVGGMTDQQEPSTDTV